jgi:hypothetical protein
MTDPAIPDLATPEQVARLFTHADGAYHFARWGRPIVPVVFGLADSTLPVVKGAIEAVVTLAGHRMAEADPDLGANLMVFYFRHWSELPQVPGLDAIVPDLAALCARLDDARACQYRLFRFDAAGAIKAAFVFLCVDDRVADVPADYLALEQAVQLICLWSDQAFADRSALMDGGDGLILRPDIATLIRACYDPVLPECSTDASHALRLFARVIACWT